MPSYRASIHVGILRAGVDPADVLPAAVRTAQEVTVVESSSVEIVRGAAVIRIRFIALHGRQALEISLAMLAAVRELATADNLQITVRRHNRWAPLPP